MKGKSRVTLIVLLCIVSTLIGCLSDNSEQEVSLAEYVAPEELDIFIVSDAVHEFYVAENREDVYYTTRMMVGEYNGTTVYGEKGFLFYDAFQKYERETGTKLNVQWYESSSEMEKDLETLEESELPDLILNTNTSNSDYYRYMEEGYFYDLTEVFEHNQMYSEGKYYNSILSAGTYDQRQYIVPILFNVSTIMGSSQQWQKIGLHLEDVETHAELMDNILYLQGEENVEHLVSQFVATAPTYLSQILYTASGEKWVDYETKTVNLEKKQFSNMASFYKQYLEEQFEVKPTAGEEIVWRDAKHVQLQIAMINEVKLDEYLDEIGCFVEGGSSYQLHLHSAGAQAWYYGSRYQDAGEDFELYAIPGVNGGSTANVSYFGMVLSSSQHPEASFHFLKYLMDSEISGFFGLSVNREVTEKQMEYFVNTSYYMRPGLKVTLKDGTLPDSSADYLIQPMKEETRDKLMAIIDDIESVTLPNYPVYYIIETQLLRYAKDECTMEEAYIKAVEDLELYVK